MARDDRRVCSIWMLDRSVVQLHDLDRPRIACCFRPRPLRHRSGVDEVVFPAGHVAQLGQSVSHPGGHDTIWLLRCGRLRGNHDFVSAARLEIQLGCVAGLSRIPRPAQVGPAEAVQLKPPQSPDDQVLMLNLIEILVHGCADLPQPRRTFSQRFDAARQSPNLLEKVRHIGHNFSLRVANRSEFDHRWFRRSNARAEPRRVRCRLAPTAPARG